MNGTAEIGPNTGLRRYGSKKSLVPGSKNVLRESLVEPNKVILPPLHIKLGLMKQFVKALNREGDCFKYLGEKCSGLPEAKLKEGVFVGPDSCRLMKDKAFESKMQDNEKEAWNAFRHCAEVSG